MTNTNSINRSLVLMLTTTMIFLILFSGIGAATTSSTIYVNQTGWNASGTFYASDTPIQAAIDNATAGDTVYVYNGIYTENVNVNKQVMLQGEGADVVTVTAASSSWHVFDVTVDYVNISGFNVTGATGNGKAGIYLGSNTDYSNISDNTISDNNLGIYLSTSSNNKLTNNSVSNNYEGIYMYSSSNYNTLTNNNASNNYYGIHLAFSSNYNNFTSNTLSNNNFDGIFLVSSSNYNTLTNNNANSNQNGITLGFTSNYNTFTNNTVSSNTNYGIYLSGTSSNIIYNNYFNNTNNAWDTGNNFWNTTKTTGTNIIGGSYLGGNYWSNYAGEDTDSDDLGDTLTPYNSSGNIATGGDYHPLLYPDTTAPAITYVNTTGWWYSGGSFNPISTTPIQAAINNATAGNTIYVYNGSYTENVNVNKQVMLQGEGADVVTVIASYRAFNVIVDYVSISGFNVTGTSNAGIYLSNSNYSHIFNNKASNNDNGIYLYYSNHNTLTNNTASKNNYGIYLISSGNNTLTNNTALSNNFGIWLRYNINNTLMNNTASINGVGITLLNTNYNTLTNNTVSSNTNNGIRLGSARYNTLTNNTVSSNTNRGITMDGTSSNNTLTNNTVSNNDYGIHLSGTSSSNTIYNNYFNNTNNALDTLANFWNTTITSGTNIIGGSWLGGNYWSDYAGADMDGDGLGDMLIPYNSSGDILTGGDYHPLVESPLETVFNGDNPLKILKNNGDDTKYPTSRYFGFNGSNISMEVNMTEPGLEVYGVIGTINLSNLFIDGGFEPEVGLEEFDFSDNSDGSYRYLNYTLPSTDENFWAIRIYAGESTETNTNVSNGVGRPDPFIIVMNLNPKDFPILGANTTDWTEIDDFTNATLTFEGMDVDDDGETILGTLGYLELLDPINMCNNDTQNALLELGNYLDIDEGNMSLDSEVLFALNVSSRLTMYDLEFDGTPGILMDGVLEYNGTSATNMISNFTWYGGDGTLVFEVLHWTSYYADGVAPTVTPITPQGTAVLNGETLSLNVSASDVSGVASVTADISNVNDTLTTAILSQSGDYWINESIIVDTRNTGTLNMQVNATDTLGISNTSVSLTVSKTTVTHYVSEGESIQAVINAANFSDTINVATGTYQENVVVNVTGLILIGSGMPVVDAMGFGNAIEVTADNVTINGFNVTNATTIAYCGIFMSSSNNTLTNNTASDNGHGILLNDSSSYNTLTNNTVNSNSNNGIYLYSSSNNTLTSNTASDNGNGIYLYSSNNYNTLTGNNASDNTNYGIYFGSSSNNTLTNNKANSNTWGIILESSCNNTLTDNTAKSNTLWDFYSESNSINNTVTNLDIGSVISFTGKDISLKSASSPVSDPSSYYNLGKYINATNNSVDSWLFMNVSYSASDISGLNENSLIMWKHDGAAWSQVSGENSVNAAENYVYANITSFSIFAPMGKKAPVEDTSGNNGGVYRPTPLPENVESQEVKGTTFSKPVESAELVFKDGNVFLVTVDAEGTISEIRLTVQSLVGKPEGIIAPQDGGIYRYLDITLGSITNDDIKGATIQFKVKKTWLSENGADTNSVALIRFHDVWETLETMFVSEDGEYYYFSATTPGFSTFAIVVEGAEGVAAVADTTTTTGVSDDADPIAQSDDMPDAEEEASGLPGFGIIMGILGIVSAILVRRK